MVLVLRSNDFLGSILGSMQAPPSLGGEAKKKAAEEKARIEKQQREEKKKLNDFREKMQNEIHKFIQDGSKEKHQFEPMDKVYRSILHEVADLAGLTSFSFGLEEEDRYVMIWKKEFAPSDEELLAYRRGEEWDPVKAKALAKEKEALAKEEAEAARRGVAKVAPATDYHQKYRHLIGDEAAKDAARTTTANRSYGFVPSHNKRDLRTIEQVLADSRAKKRQRQDTPGEGSSAESAVSPPKKQCEDESESGDV